MTEETARMSQDQELVNALRKAALGGEYKEIRRDTVRDREGKIVKGGKATQITKTLPPDPALIKELLGEKIGGPQDWC